VADPATYGWRDDALNVYVNGSNTGIFGGLAFQPSDIMAIAQNSGARVILHETGHSMNLFHTHATDGADGGDECSDTILDDPSWTRDDIALNNFGATYGSLSPAQQGQVDLVWQNIMSYHPGRSLLSPCQLDRMSAEGYLRDPSIYSKTPVYADSSASGFQDGSFEFPFTPAAGTAAVAFTPNILVLQAGTYPLSPVTISVPVAQVIPRLGPARIEDPALYVLPHSPEMSHDPSVGAAARAAQQADTDSRRTRREAERLARGAGTAEESARIRRLAVERGKQFAAEAMVQLGIAAQAAQGEERVALHMELGQRHEQAGEWAAAATYFEMAAQATTQKRLQAQASANARRCRGRSGSE
jgi:hypothetical protein